MATTTDTLPAFVHRGRYVVVSVDDLEQFLVRKISGTLSELGVLKCTVSRADMIRICGSVRLVDRLIKEGRVKSIKGTGMQRRMYDRKQFLDCLDTDLKARRITAKHRQCTIL